MHDPSLSHSRPRLGCLAGTFKPSRRQAFDPLVIDLPPRPAQELHDLAIAVAAVLPGQGDHVGSQPLLVFRAPRHLALRRAMLAERRTSAALGDMQVMSDMLDTGAATRGA